MDNSEGEGVLMSRRTDNIPECVDDDHFTWWHDEYRHPENKPPVNPYELMGAAWMEAVRRITRDYHLIPKAK